MDKSTPTPTTILTPQLWLTRFGQVGPGVPQATVAFMTVVQRPDKAEVDHDPPSQSRP